MNEGEAAAKNDRDFLLVDESSDAVDVMEQRLAAWEPEVVRVIKSSPA